MNIRLISLELICVLGLLSGARAMDIKPSVAMQEYLKPSFQFAYSVFQNLSATSGSNVALSMTALLNSLTMLYEGAAGETERILADVVHFPTDKELMRSALLSIYKAITSSIGSANVYKRGTRFFAADGVDIAGGFKMILHSYYPHSGIEQVNFGKAQATAGRINWWVREQTNGSIPNIVHADDLSSDTELVITSVEFFKGLWKTPFNPKNTQDLPFHLTRNETVNVPVMYSKGKYHVVQVEGGYTLLRLPYQGSNLSFVIVLPDEGQSLDDVAEKAPNSFLFRPNVFVNSLKECEIFVPKFSVEASVDLTPLFRKTDRLGQLFSQPSSFSTLVDDRTLTINSVTQKTRIEVDEFGSTAAAAQASLISRRMMMTDNCYVHATRPFLFYIQQDDVPVPLFVGKILRPTA